MAHRTPTGLLALALGGLMLAAVWTAGSPGAPPVYDGLCTTQAYTLHPQPATENVTVSNGDIQTTELSTNETPNAQASIIVSQGSLIIPPGTNHLVLSIAAVPAPSTTVKGGQLNGNVYDFRLTANGQPVALRKAGPFPTVILSPDNASLNGTAMVHYIDGHWVQLQTVFQGCANQLATEATGFGDFSVITLGGSASTNNATRGSSARSSTTAGLLLIGLAVLVGLALIGFVVFSRRGGSTR